MSWNATRKRKARERDAVVRARKLIEQGLPNVQQQVTLADLRNIRAGLYSKAVVLNADWLVKVELP